MRALPALSVAWVAPDNSAVVGVTDDPPADGVVVVIPTDGSEPWSIGRRAFASPPFSLDGRWAYLQDAPDDSVYGVDLETRAEIDLGPGRFAAEDGSFVYLVAGIPGEFEVWRVSRIDGAREMLTARTPAFQFTAIGDPAALFFLVSEGSDPGLYGIGLAP